MCLLVLLEVLLIAVFGLDLRCFSVRIIALKDAINYADLFI